jgi:hypothetical protein
LLRFATSLMDRRVSRRSFLVRMATGGSALAVDPLRYILRPIAAEAVIDCSDCSPGSRCCDGWTAFCCTVNSDGGNYCPSNTFKGGWWKCTNYTGTKMCNPQNVRYYIDCNLRPGSSCSGGCKCADGSCSNRSTCCNVFRYGQCHTEVPEVTAIVCRLIRCRNPCELWPACNCTYKEDNDTCAHEEGCP